MTEWKEQATNLGVEVRRVEVDVVDAFALDRRMQDVLGTCTEVAAMEVPEHLRRTDVGGLVCAVARIDRLLPFEQEEARART